MRINPLATLMVGGAALVLAVALWTGSNDPAHVQAGYPAPGSATAGLASPNLAGAVTIGVEADGLNLGFFNAVSGLGSESDVKEKVVQNNVQTNPGKVLSNRVVLTRGLSTSLDAYDWRQQVVDGDIGGARKNVTVILYDRAASPIAAFNLLSAWPCLYEVDPIDSTTAVATESLHICHNGFERLN
jgi:phage tail-like protein